MESDNNQPGSGKGPAIPTTNAPAPQTNPMPPSQPVAASNDGSSDALTIVGLILAVFMWPAGLVISIICYRKYKKMGKHNTLAQVGIILSSIMVGLFMLGILGAIFLTGSESLKNQAHDSFDTAAAKHIGTGIEAYVASYGTFPETLTDLKKLPKSSFDSGWLRTHSDGSFNYEVTPAGCDKTSTCTGYRVWTQGGTGTIEYSNHTTSPTSSGSTNYSPTNSGSAY